MSLYLKKQAMFQPHKITTEPLPDMSQGKLQNSSPVSASLMKRTSCDILIISGAVETVLWRNITSDHLHDIHEEIFKSVPCIVTEDKTELQNYVYLGQLKWRVKVTCSAIACGPIPCGLIRSSVWKSYTGMWSHSTLSHLSSITICVRPIAFSIPAFIFPWHIQRTWRETESFFSLCFFFLQDF